MLQIYRIQIEIILLNNSRIMKNSAIKYHRHTVSNPFSDCSTFDKCQSPLPQDLKPYFGGNHPYDSNYSYLAKKMGENQYISQGESPKPTHLRYNSLGNSRATIKNGQAPSQHKLPNNESSPYLLQFNSKQNKNCEQKPKNITRNDSQPFLSSPSNLSKHTMKLSMKNVHKNAFNTVFNERQCLMRESQISTTNQTYHTPSIDLKYAQQKIMKDQLLKYFSVSIQKNLNTLKIQINQQNTIITNLETQINTLNNKIMSKQKAILELTNSISNRKEKPKNNFQNLQNQLNPQNQKNQIYLTKRINLLENQVNQTLRTKIYEQADIQNKINNRIDKILGILAEKQNLNTIPQTNQIAGEVNNFSNNLKKYSEALNRNLSSLTVFKQIRCLTFSMRNQLQQIKKVLIKPSSNISILEQTAQFKFQQSRNNHHRDSPYKQDLNDSNSYFFHPSQLGNIDKITQLFINRQGQPIKCYTDSFNQVKYKDTNTYMFNKKGDIVQLTDKQKRYYIDKGFIIKAQ